MCYKQSLERISLYLHVTVLVYLACDQLRVLAVLGAFPCFVAVQGIKPRGLPHSWSKSHVPLR